MASSMIRQSKAVDEHLRDRLQGERSVVIARLVGLAVGTHYADAKSVALFGGKLWLVVAAP
jgi:hypothetical protein